MKRIIVLLMIIPACFLFSFAAIIPVEPGTRTVRTAVSNANAGDTLLLTSGVYDETSNITIEKKLVIKADKDAESQPVMNITRISVKADFSVHGVIIDGNSTAADAIRLEAGVGIKVKMHDCILRNFTNRGFYFYATDKTVLYVEELDIKGCIFENLLRVIHAPQAPIQVNKVNISNSTFNKLDKDGYFINISVGDTGLPQGTEVTIDHCTFYNCTSRRGVYLADLDGSTVKNCIASYNEVIADTKSFAVYGSNSIVKNTISHNVDLYGSAPQENIQVRNPLFVDAENGNFQLYANSPGVSAADDGSNLGDPRWGVSEDDAPGSLPYEPFKKPYSMSPTANSVRILWQMLDNNPNAMVYYGKTPDLGQSVSSEDGWVVEGEGFVHVVELTGLDPFSTYYYQVGNETQRFEEIYTAKTAPEKGTDFRLVSLSDIHDNHQRVWENMTHRIVEQNPDVLFFIGDLVNYGDQRPWNSSFFTPGSPVLSRYSFSCVVGNHETNDKKTEDGPTTHYDYFSVQSHGYIDSENEFIDPRGEAYFAFDYGDVKMIGFNINGGDHCPAYAEGSPQYQWLDEQLENADSKWIFMFGHVSIYSTSYHAQWSAEEKRQMTPLLEKHAANGKHIIVFSGDEHNFEHLYKAGVHYVRPGAANQSLRDQYFMADRPYSLLFNKTAGFSTIDVSENGEKVLLTARDTTGTEFYSYTFTRTTQMLPSLYLTKPDGNEEEVTDMYRIKWTCFDPTGDAKINLYATLDKDTEGNLIAENLSTDLEETDSFDWNVRFLPQKGDYYIYGVINDGINPGVTNYAKGTISVTEDTTPPPATTNFTGNLADGKIILSWLNPTHLIPVENKIDDFENGIDKFIGEGDDGDGSLSVGVGYEGGSSLQINYDVTKEWGQYAGVIKFPEVQNFEDTPFLEFRYKGDGSSRSLRLMVKQDLDMNGAADDWWYNETLDLSSTEWKFAKVDLRTFQALTWHPNSSKSLETNNMFSIEFIVPSSNIGNGTVCIDDIVLTGEILPAPDYKGTKILRRTDRFPADNQDGEVIYDGDTETCQDSDVSVGNTYYYASFTYDDLYNYSEFSSSASWKYIFDLSRLDKTKLQAVKIYPNPVRTEAFFQYSSVEKEPVSVVIYDVTGTTLSENNFINNVGLNQIKLDFSVFSGGFYFVKIKIGEAQVVKEVIVKK